MTADYKNRNTRKTKRKGPPGWVWFASGLLVGLFAAFLFYLKGAHLLPATAEKPPPPASTATQAPPPRAARPKSGITAKPRQEAHRPRFEFYEMLPEMEIPVADVDVDPARNRDAPGADRYLLQVASFRALEDADRLRARLTLQGMTASIQTVVIDGSNTWHRVRTGPYQRISEMEKVRNLLREDGLQPIPLKVAGG